MRWRPKRRPRTEARSRRKNTLASGKGLTNQGPLQKPGLSERNPGFHTWGMQPRVTLGLHPGYELLLRLIEVSEVGGTLALLCGHDETLGTQKVRLTLDPDVRVVLRAVVLDPPGLVDKAAAVVLGDGPGTHQGVVEHGDFIVDVVRFVFLERVAFLDDGLVVRMQRDAARVEGAGPF